MEISAVWSQRRGESVGERVGGGGGEGEQGVRSGSLVSWHRYQRLLRHPRHLYVLFDQDTKNTKEQSQ